VEAGAAPAGTVRAGLPLAEGRGYSPEVIKAHGWALLPEAFNRTAAAGVERLTGQKWVPVLVTDDDEVIKGSYEIEAWAKAHPAGAKAPAATA